MKISKKIKKYFYNVFIIIIVVFFTFFYLKKENVLSIENFKKINLWHLLLIYGFFLLSYGISAFINFQLYNEVNIKWRLKDTFGDLMIGHLGSGITPYRIGYYPLKFYYQNKKGFTFEESLIAITKSQMLNSISIVTFYFVLIIGLLFKPLNFSIEEEKIKFIYVVLIGFAVNFMGLLFFIFLAFSKKIKSILIKILANVLHKFKRIKAKDEYYNQQIIKMDIYYHEIMVFKKHLLKYLPLMLLYLIQIILLCSLPYISYLIVSNNPYSFYDFIYCYLLYLASSYISNIFPLPGGSGSFEIMFFMLYENIFHGEILGSTLLLWRIGSFYLPLVIELIYFFIFTFRKKRSI